MPADPRPTTSYRQEFLRGEAEYQAWIVLAPVSTRVPDGRVHDALRSLEWSRLEKDVVSEKIYGPGLGIVREHDLSGGDEVHAGVGHAAVGRAALPISVVEE